MEQHTTPNSKNFADLNQNSATLLAGKADIVEPNENGVLSNGVHVEDKNENRPRLSELDKQTPDSIADMTASSSHDTGFGSASVSEVSSPVENHGVAGRLQNQNAESETEGETYDNVVLGDETDNDENTLNDDASHENVLHMAHTKDANNDVEADNEDNEKTENENVHTAHTEDVNDVEADNEDNEKTDNENIFNTSHTDDANDVAVDNEDSIKTKHENVVHTAHTETVNNDVEADENNETTEKPVDSETQNTSVENQINGSGEEGIIEKAEVEHVNLASDVAENPVADIIEDHITETEQKLVASGNVGSTEHKEPENENVDDTASDKIIDRNVDDATNTNLEKGQNNEVNDFDISENVEYSEVQFINTDDAVEVVTESCEGPTNDNVEEGDNKLKEPEIAQPASNDVENENIEKVTNDTLNVNIEQATNDITLGVEAEKEAGYEAKTEDAANEREQHTLDDMLTDIEKAAIDEDQTVDDVTGAVEDEKAGNEEEKGIVDILGNGLLKKKVLVAGKGVHTRPNNGDIVTVKVDGQLPDGTHVDTEEITFNLNEGDVLLAFDLAVALMEEGEKCELFTSERYAYGSLGREPDIPKGTSITYTLELVKIEQPPTVTEMNYDQRLRIGEAKRERGNYLFGRTDYSGAINSYNRAVKLLDNPELNEGIDESCRSVLTESWVKCYNNLAACQLKIDAVDSAIKSCEKVLSVQKDNVKALFRLAKAYGVKGEIDKAIGHLRRAIKLDPESKFMQQEMLNLTRRKSKETATEKELYKRMLGVRSGDKSLEEENRKGNSNKLVKWTLVAGGIAAVLISVGLTWYRSS